MEDYLNVNNLTVVFPYMGSQNVDKFAMSGGVKHIISNINY